MRPTDEMDVELCEILDLQELAKGSNEELREMAVEMDDQIRRYVESQVPEHVKVLAAEIAAEEPDSWELFRRLKKRKMEAEGKFAGWWEPKGDTIL
jgi:hypothetical protein